VTLGDHRDEPLERLVDLTIDECASGDDDVVVVALRPIGPRPRTFSTSIRSHPRNMRTVRHALRHWLDGIGTTDPLADDLLIAVSEAMANARDHAYQGADDGEIVVTGRVRTGKIELSIRDRGRWAPSVRTPTRGRGVLIMEAVADEYRISATPEGIEVCLVAALDRPVEPA